MSQNIIYRLLGRSVSGEEKMFFVQHLALMFRAGVSLPKAMEILSLQTDNKYWRNILNDVKRRLVEGNSLEKSLSKHQDVFGMAFISMIGVGELKGDLASVLDKFFQLMQTEEDLKRKVKAAVSYPIVILVSMLFLGLAALFYIFPRISAIFEEVNVKLPLPTRMIIGLSNIGVNYGALILFLAVILVILFIFVIKTEKGKYWFHSFLLKLPIVSPIIKKRNLARLSRNLGTLLRAGVPISASLQATSNVLNNLFYRKSVIDAGEEIKKGKFIYNAFSRYPDIYPNLFIQILIVGEEAGVLDETLSELASFYEKKVADTFASLATLIEPILILVFGVGVAFMALSILLPIYSLAQI